MEARPERRGHEQRARTAWTRRAIARRERLQRHTAATLQAFYQRNKEEILQLIDNSRAQRPRRQPLSYVEVGEANLQRTLGETTVLTLHTGLGRAALLGTETLPGGEQVTAAEAFWFGLIHLIRKREGVTLNRAKELIQAMPPICE